MVVVVVKGLISLHKSCGLRPREDPSTRVIHLSRSRHCSPWLEYFHTPSLYTERCTQIFSRHATHYSMYTGRSIVVQGGTNGIKNWKFRKIKWSLVIIIASRYHVQKSMYEFSKRFIRK